MICLLPVQSGRGYLIVWRSWCGWVERSDRSDLMRFCLFLNHPCYYWTMACDHHGCSSVLLLDSGMCPSWMLLILHEVVEWTPTRQWTRNWPSIRASSARRGLKHTVDRTDPAYTRKASFWQSLAERQSVLMGAFECDDLWRFNC